MKVNCNRKKILINKIWVGSESSDYSSLDSFLLNGAFFKSGLSSCTLLEGVRRTQVASSTFYLEVSSAKYPASSGTSSTGHKPRGREHSSAKPLAIFSHGHLVLLPTTPKQAPPTDLHLWTLGGGAHSSHSSSPAAWPCCSHAQSKLPLCEKQARSRLLHSTGGSVVSNQSLDKRVHGQGQLYAIRELQQNEHPTERAPVDRQVPRGPTPEFSPLLRLPSLLADDGQPSPFPAVRIRPYKELSPPPALRDVTSGLPEGRKSLTESVGAPCKVRTSRQALRLAAWRGRGSRPRHEPQGANPPRAPHHAQSFLFNSGLGFGLAWTGEVRASGAGPAPGRSLKRSWERLLLSPREPYEGVQLPS